MTQTFSKVSVVGLGLLGGSLVEAIRQKYPSIRITGVSSEKTTEAALKEGLIDEAFSYTSINKALNTDLLFLCTPITHILETLTLWQKSLPPLDHKVIVTDVGSTKTQICELGKTINKKNNLFYFIGSHPMAGSEKRGLGARNPHLFENAPWIFCDEQENSNAKTLQSFLAPLGISPHWLSPTEHDISIAKISHLPQVLSSCLAGFFLKHYSKNKKALDLAGPGFRDMTRISQSVFSVWEPIFKTNHQNILKELKGLHQYMNRVINSFSQKKYEQFFLPGSNWPEETKDQIKIRTANQPAEIRVVCPDQPGQLAKILAPLSLENINILDIEVLQVRENEAGTIRLVVPDKISAEKAFKIITQNGNEATLIQ